jgi:predicted  nucleic acid-binding Zn ribbon protein
MEGQKNLYLAEITFVSKKEFDREEVEDTIYSLLGSLRMNGQIIGDEFSIILTNQGYAAYQKLPLSNSLDISHANKYVLKDLEKLESNGVSLAINIMGEKIESTAICECKNRKSLIFFTNYLTTESPLRCGDCFGTIPLYLIPHTYDDEYYNVITWQSDYKACDSLQMGCKTGERFGSREISKIDSSLSRRGIEICTQITDLTGLPYRHNDQKRLMEEKRKCPSCSGGWLLKEPLHELFDFKCDRCRLLSNISWSVR